MEGNRRKLGSNELFHQICHSHDGNLNVLCGLTLVTRHAVDEGLMKCALQEFQHMFPHLTSRLKRMTSGNGTDESCLCFVPMECPILPLDTGFKCKDMLHDKFDEEKGPLWRVQLITESTMDAANLGFGPELSAIVEDDSSESTRWRYFLRYNQGKVNQGNIEPFDDTEEGFRSFILMAFHPSVTDLLGTFHLMRQFLVILDSILAQDGNTAPPPSVGVAKTDNLPPPIDSLLPANGNSKLSTLFSVAKSVGEYVMPRKSPLSLGGSAVEQGSAKTQVLRGWLTDTQTRELLATMDEDDCHLQGVITAAALCALDRVLACDEPRGLPVSTSRSLRLANEVNFRQYVGPNAPKLGCLSGYYECDYGPVQGLTGACEFWKLAHELTVKHNGYKDSKEWMVNQFRRHLRPGQAEMVLGSPDIRAEMSVGTLGNLSYLFRRGPGTEATVMQSIDTWSKPLHEGHCNIRLEDVFHVVNHESMSIPFHVSAHILHGRLNFFLAYSTKYVGDQRYPFTLRDETINILRMAVDRSQE